jgi:hypothetical protein
MIKTAKPIGETTDNSLEVGMITLTVTRKEFVPIKASRTGALSYGQLVDEAINNFYLNNDRNDAMLQSFEIQINEDEAYALRNRVLSGELS